MTPANYYRLNNNFERIVIALINKSPTHKELPFITKPKANSS